MNPLGSKTCPRSSGLVALAVLVLLVARGAGAIDVPQSAYSTSLGMDPLLLDHWSLSYRFPQLLAGRSSGFDVSSTVGRLGLRGTLAWDQSAFAAGYQPANDLHPSLAREAIHAAWATRLSAWKIGIAGRWAGRDTKQLDASDVGSDSERSQELSSIEGTLGLSFEASNTSVDLVLEIRSDTREEKWTTIMDGGNITRRQWKTDSDPRLAAAFRATLPAGDGAELVVAGGWQDLTERWEEQITPGSDPPERYGSYADHWNAGAALSLNAPHVDRVRLHTMYEEVMMRPAISMPSYVEILENRKLTVGLAVEKTLYQKLRALAGIHAKRVSDIREDTFISDSQVRSTRYESTYVLDTFSWGVQYEVWGLDLTARLSTSLGTDNLFSTIDAVIPF